MHAFQILSAEGNGTEKRPQSGKVLSIAAPFKNCAPGLERARARDFRQKGLPSRKGRISLVGFYWRRALRLLPALAVLCIVFLMLSIFVKPGIYLALKEVSIVALYAGNWVMAFKFGWMHYLGHTWPLAIEEQFYFFWPVFLGAGRSFLPMDRGARPAP